MKLIPTEKEPGCLVHFTRFEAREVMAYLDEMGGLDESLPRHKTVLAFKTQLARWLRDVEREGRK